MKPEELNIQKLWEAEQQILDVVAQFCEKNHIRYSLVYGTLLGAVRHKGFIPWDDDIDLMMPREDYDRFIHMWTDKAPDGFILDLCESDAENCNTFSKVRKDHSTYLQFDSERSTLHHKGIYVDIFPADKKAPGKLRPIIQYIDFAFMLLYNRGRTSGDKGLLELAERILLKLIPKRKYHAVSLFFGKKGRRWNHVSKTEYVIPVTIRDCKRYYPPSLFDNLEKTHFNGKDYYAFRDAHTFLTIRYGDYMTLPPENERVLKHPPLLVDFCRNYDEIPAEERLAGTEKDRILSGLNT